MATRLIGLSGGATVGLAALVSGTADAAPAGGWPTYAHDFHRTARADGVGDMHNPTVAWTLPLGGALNPLQSLVTDVDGDGRANVLTISGGRVVATNPDGTTLWKGALAGSRALVGVWALSGGTPDVVVDTPSGTQILSGTDGHLLTTLSMGAPVAGVFVPGGADASSGGILVLVTSRGPVSGFDFRSGTSVTTALWTATSNNQTSYLVGDVDGDGILALVHPLDNGFEIDNPLPGAVKYSLTSHVPDRGGCLLLQLRARQRRWPSRRRDHRGRYQLHLQP